MKQRQIGSYLHILDRNELPDGTQILHINELPPPYSVIERQHQQQQQFVNSDWKDEFIELRPLNDNTNKYGFVINGGIDGEFGPSIVITHIESCSKSSLDNGRSNLRLFDRILSINGIDL